MTSGCELGSLQSRTRPDDVAGLSVARPRNSSSRTQSAAGSLSAALALRGALTDLAPHCAEAQKLKTQRARRSYCYPRANSSRLCLPVLKSTSWLFAMSLFGADSVVSTSPATVALALHQLPASAHLQTERIRSPRPAPLVSRTVF